MDKYAKESFRAKHCIENYWSDLLDISNKYTDCKVVSLDTMECSGSGISNWYISALSFKQLDKANEPNWINLCFEKGYILGDIFLNFEQGYKGDNVLMLKPFVEQMINYPDKMIYVGCEYEVSFPILINDLYEFCKFFVLTNRSSLYPKGDTLDEKINSYKRVFKNCCPDIKFPCVIFDSLDREDDDCLEFRDYQNVKQLK